MKNIYDKKIDLCLKDYKLKEFICSRYIPYTIFRMKMKGCLKELKNEIDKGTYGNKRVCICDIHTKRWIKKWLLVDNSQTDFLIVNEGGTDRELVEDIAKRIKQCNGEVTVIGMTGYELNQRVNAAIYGLGLGQKYIDVYTYLADRNIHTCETDACIERRSMKETLKRIINALLRYYAYQFSWFRFIIARMSYFSDLVDSRLPLYIYYNTRHAYFQNNYLNRENAYRRLIAAYIKVRDFRNLILLLDGETNLWSKQLRESIISILGEIKSKVDQSNSNNIIINWIDNVSILQMENNMKWINSQRCESIDFVNSYAVTTTTSWEFKALFSGKRPIKDKLFLQGKCRRNNGYSVLDALLEDGYHLEFFGGQKKAESMMDREFCRKSKGVFGHYLSTEVQWRAVCHLAQSNEEKSLVIIHDLCECHQPFFSNELEGIMELVPGDYPELQKKQALEYLDEEIKWYEEYYGKNLQVFFSDHGDHSVPEAEWKENKTHIFFFVKDKENAQRIEEMVSVKDIMQILLRIVKKEKWNDLLSIAIDIERYDLYSSAAIESALTGKWEKGRWMQFQARRTKDDVYILYADGTEEYYRNGDETHDLSSELKYRNHIDSIKNNLEPCFINIYKFDFFKKSRLLYDRFKVKQLTV